MSCGVMSLKCSSLSFGTENSLQNWRTKYNASNCTHMKVESLFGITVQTAIKKIFFLIYHLESEKNDLTLKLISSSNKNTKILFLPLWQAKLPDIDLFSWCAESNVLLPWASRWNQFQYVSISSHLSGTFLKDNVSFRKTQRRKI